MELQDVMDALATIVTQRRNQLRKEESATLRARPRIDSESEPFRDRTVLLGIATEAADDGSVTVLLRGFVSPHLTTRAEQWAGFVKRPDETWSPDLDDEVHDRLRARIESALPMV